MRLDTYQTEDWIKGPAEEEEVAKHMGPGDHPSGSGQSAHGRRTLYRGEGSLDHPSYYTSQSGMAGGWWTTDFDAARRYALSTVEGKVYEIEVDSSEVEARGLHYFIPDPEVRARRKEINKHMGPGDHPSGTSQQSHAGSRLIPIDPTAPHFPDLDNTFSALPRPLAIKVKAQTEKLGTKRQIMARYRALLANAKTRLVATSGLTWYSDTHAWLERLAADTGYSTEQAAGAAAAMSSGLRWEAAPGKASNKAAAEAMMLHFGADLPLSSYPDFNYEAVQAALEKDALSQRIKPRGADPLFPDPPTLTPDTKLSDLTHPRQAAMVWSGVWKTEGYSLPAQYGYDPFMDSIEILRGAPVGNYLAGPKRRSFFNNLMLIDNDDVTIDVQMMGAARGSAFNSNVAADRSLQTSLVGTPKLGNIGVGVHPVLADYVRELTTELNTSGDHPWGKDLSPMQVQAILWTEYKTRNAADG